MSYDLALNADRDLDLSATAPIEGLQRIKQQITIGLLTFLDEWFLDVTWGVPYVDKILIKSPRRSEIESILRAKVSAVPNVIAVKEIDISIDPRTRGASVNMPDIQTDWGQASVSVTNV